MSQTIKTPNRTAPVIERVLTGLGCEIRQFIYDGLIFVPSPRVITALYDAHFTSNAAADVISAGQIDRYVR